MKPHLLNTKFKIWLLVFSLSGIGAASLPTISPHEISQKQSGNIVFAVIGDYGKASQTEADVASLVKSWNPDFIVTVGDNNYPNGAASTMDENIGQYYHDYIFPYRGKFGAGAAYKRFFPALGNHDWGTNSLNPYFNYFSFYNDIGYYDFIKGSIHFFVLDSDPHEPDGTSSTSEQAKWLKKGLAASTSDFNIVVLHHAPYSSGKHGSTAYTQWPYKAWGADAVLSGHDHIYERLIIDGLPYFVNGVGGAELYEFGNIVPGSQIRFNQDYGAMRVEANNFSMKFQFFTRAGVLVDEYTVSKSVPTVTSIGRINSNPSNATTLDFLVTFSETVTGVDASDFSLNTTNITGASVNSVSGAGNIYTVSVNTGNGDGTVRLDLIDNDSIVNNYGNKLGDAGTGNGNYINGETYNMDKVSPVAASIIGLNSNPTNSTIVDFQVNFSEPVIGLDSIDFAIISSNGATVNAINGLGNIYTVSVNTDQGNDQLRLDLIDNDSITDIAGNLLGGNGTGNGSFVNGEIYTVDRIAPVVTSIIRAGANPSSDANIDFIVTFSEVVNNVDTSDFSLTTTNITNAFISSISNSGPFYIVTVNTGMGTGTIRLDLADDDSITDVAGNSTGGTGTGNGIFFNGETYKIEKSAPIVTSMVRANTNPSNSQFVDWIVTFSDSVSGVDVFDFSLSAANISNAAINNVSGSGSSYIISVHTGSGDGDLHLNLIDNDSIINESGILLGNIGIDNGSYTNGETYAIDKIAPTATSIIRASANPTSAFSIDFIVTFSEPVTSVDSSDFKLNAENITNASINLVSNVNPFYIVTVNTGNGTGAIRLDLSDDDSITDFAGNRLGGPGLGNGDFVNGEIYAIEKSLPRVTSINRASPNPANSARVDYIVTFSEPVTGVDISDFSLNTTNVINASIINVTNVDPFYIVTVNTGAGTGTIRLDLIDNDSIGNIAGSKPGGAGVGNGNFVNGEIYSISKTAVKFFGTLHTRASAKLIDQQFKTVIFMG